MWSSAAALAPAMRRHAARPLAWVTPAPAGIRAWPRGLMTTGLMGGCARPSGRLAAAAAAAAGGGKQVGRPLRHMSNRLWDASHGWLTPVNVLIAINVAVFAFWSLHGSQKAWWRRWFNRYVFLSNSRVRRYGTPLLAHLFMHADLLHLGGNMLALKSFGDSLLPVLGARRFVGLYMASGMVGAVAQLAYHALVPRTSWPAAAHVQYDSVSVGASAAIAGIVFYTFALMPHGQVLLVILPIPNMVFVAAFLAWSSYSAYTGGAQSSNWAHAAHLGGAATGVAYFIARRMARR